MHGCQQYNPFLHTKTTKIARGSPPTRVVKIDISSKKKTAVLLHITQDAVGGTDIVLLLAIWSINLNFIYLNMGY